MNAMTWLDRALDRLVLELDPPPTALVDRVLFAVRRANRADRRN
ncbi:hypothetical protein [Solihabitans fulvus]|nr:hypothetical protein [Solihabitans fulvus]